MKHPWGPREIDVHDSWVIFENLSFGSEVQKQISDDVLRQKLVFFTGRTTSGAENRLLRKILHIGHLLFIHSHGC